MKRLATRIIAMSEVSEEEQKEFALWAWQARGRTTFDLDIIGHKHAVMFMTENGGKTSYLPVQTALVAEAFIPRPGSDNREKAHSLGMLDNALVLAAKRIEMQVIYTYIPDRELDYIEKVQRHGWQEVPNVRLFKKTVSL